MELKHFSIGFSHERERRLIGQQGGPEFRQVQEENVRLKQENEELKSNLDVMNRRLQALEEAQKVAAVGPSMARAVSLPQAKAAMRERIIERYQGEKPSSFDQQPPLTRTRYSSEIGCYREYFDRQSNRWVKGEIIKSAQEVHDHGTQRMMEREQHFAQEKARFDRAGIVLKGYNQNRRSIANQNWQQQQRVDAAFASVGGRPEMPPPNVLPPPPKSALQPRGGFAFSRPASRFPTEADMKLTPEEQARLPEIEKRMTPPSAREVELDRALNEVDKRMGKTAKDRGLSSREFVEMKDGRSLFGDKIGDLEHAATKEVLVTGPGGASPVAIFIESNKPGRSVRSFGLRVNKFTGTFDNSPENRRAIEYMKYEGLSAKIQKGAGGYDVFVSAHKNGSWNIRATDRMDRWSNKISLESDTDGDLIARAPKKKEKKENKKEDDLIAAADLPEGSLENYKESMERIILECKILTSAAFSPASRPGAEFYNKFQDIINDILLHQVKGAARAKAIQFIEGFYKDNQDTVFKGYSLATTPESIRLSKPSDPVPPKPQETEKKPEVKPAIPKWMTEDLKDIDPKYKNDVLKVVSDFRVDSPSHVSIALWDKTKLSSGLEYMKNGSLVGIKNARIESDRLEVDVDAQTFWEKKNLDLVMSMVVLF